MTTTSDEKKTFDIRNQVMLERLKVGEHKKFEPYLKELDKKIRARLNDAGDSIQTKKELNRVLSDIEIIQRDIYEEYQRQLVGDLGDIAVSQAAFEAKGYDKAVAGFESKKPSVDQLKTALRVNPLQVENYTGDPLLEPFIKDWSRTQKRRVKTTIQQGFSQGQTNAQIISNIRGTRAAKFNDGDLARVNRSNKTIVRTAVQHSATQARVSTMSANDDLVKGYEWVSTLDSRTCLAKNELILMGDGSKKAIQDIKVGEVVIGHSGEPRRVMNTIAKTTERLLRVTLSNGNIVMCTDDHLWLTSNRGWVEAGELNGNDDIVEGKKI